MKTTNTQALPAPPSLFKTVAAGFDKITNNISLILFPIGLDLLIWFAPRLSLKHIIEGLVGDLFNSPFGLSTDQEAADMMKSVQELWSLVAEKFNLMVALRSYPVGIPSLMPSILPLESPINTPDFIEVTSFGVILSVFFVLSLIGLILGTMFYSLVAKAAISDTMDWQQIFRSWPGLSFQVILLALIWFFLFLAVSIPGSCIISLATLSGFVIGQCIVLIYGGILIWMLIPLMFSAHGIFIGYKNAWTSIKQGILITRMTLPTTSLFFLGVLVLTQGLDFIWRVPQDNSWLMLISVAGHGFVTTGLLSASFVYYRDADRWVQSLQGDG
jgi:hypothetical protein